MREEFYLNGEKLNGFKFCDFLLFSDTYKYFEILIQEDDYVKYAMADEEGKEYDVWEIKTNKGVENEF